MSFDDDEIRSASDVPSAEAFLEVGASDELLEQAELGSRGDPGIALLVDMARRGEIDPWNIDIIDVTDKFLAALARGEGGFPEGVRLSPADLARSARCIFYAAALHNMKARALAERHARALYDATATDDLVGDGLDGRRGLRPGDLPLVYPDRDRGMLAPRERRPRERAITLLDLISALRSFDERMATREALLAEAPAWDAELAYGECIEGAHQDRLEQDKADVRVDLARTLLLSPDARVEDRALVTGERSRARVFLALLSLANDEEVDLEQERIYGELWVRLGTRFGRPLTRSEDEPAPASSSAAEEA